MSKTETILGDPIQAQNAAGSVQLDPIAVISVGADKVPRVLAVDGEAESAVGRLVDQIPDLLMRAAKGLGERVVAPALAGSTEKSLAEKKPG